MKCSLRLSPSKHSLTLNIAGNPEIKTQNTTKRAITVGVLQVSLNSDLKQARDGAVATVSGRLFHLRVVSVKMAYVLGPVDGHAKRARAGLAVAHFWFYVVGTCFESIFCKL